MRESTKHTTEIAAWSHADRRSLVNLRAGNVPDAWTRWVGISVVVGGALIVLRAPWPWALTEVLVVPGWVVGRDLWTVIFQARRSAWAAVARGHERSRLAGAHRRLDPITHDPFRTARAVLRCYSTPIAQRALDTLENINKRLEETLPDRDAQYAGSAFRFHDEGGTLVRYGDPDRVPAFLGPTGRDVFMRVGRTLDDVRLLHNLRIEKAVLLFTFWARALLLGLAPLLGAITFGPVPLHQGSTTVEDILWAVALVYAIAVTVRAPRLSQIVLERTEQAQQLRRRLVLVEVPIATALMIAFPAWPTAAFAAGWTNWWQRNFRPPGEKAEFSWPRLVVYVLVVIASLIAGFLFFGRVSPVHAAEEIVVSLIVIAAVGGSYGAMFPLSGAVLADRGGLPPGPTPRTAAHKAGGRAGDR